MVKKTKIKFLLVLMVILLLVSTCCYATETSDSTITLSGDDLSALVSQGTSENTIQTTTDATDASASDVDWTYTDYFACDQSVTLTGVIDGNAFIIGKDVTIKGEVGGDLFVMAENLNIDGGYVYSSIFAMAKEITMNGITYDLYAMCSDFKLESNGFVYRDMKVAGNDISLSGKIRRDAYVVGNKLTLDETAGTIVYGNLNYTSAADSYTAPEGTVAGEVNYTQETTNTKSIDVDKDALATVSVWTVIINKIKNLVSTLVTALLVTLFLVLVLPKFTKKISDMKVGKAFASLGIGILTWPVAILVCGLVIGLTLLLLILTLGALEQLFFVSLMLSAILFLVLTLFTALSTAATCAYFGKLFAKLIKKDGKLFTILFSLLVALVLWIVCLIPVLGGLIGFLAWTFGLGVILVNLLPCKKAKEDKTADPKFINE